MAAKRSGEQRIETPESGNVRVGSLRTNQRRHRRAGTSIVTGAIGAQSAGASFWLHCVACVALDTRRLTASASEASPALRRARGAVPRLSPRWNVPERNEASAKPAERVA